MQGVELDRMNGFLIQKQHLTDGTRGSNVLGTVRDISGLHATSPTTPYLSLFARVRDFKRETLDRELYVKRTLGRIRYVRMTVYIIPKDFIPAAFAATRMMAEPMSEAYSRFLGIDQKMYRETSKRILGFLRGRGGITVRSIRNELGTELNISPVVNLMCDQGLLIRGAPEKGWKSNVHNYHLFDEYFPDLRLGELDERDARRLVIERYLSSFGPATEADVSWWTGFPKSQTREMVRDLGEKVTCVDSGDKSYLMLSEQAASFCSVLPRKEHVVNLLPSLDPYLMGYRERDRYLDPKDYDYVFDRSGNVTSTILLDGRVVGIWDFEEPNAKVFFLRNVDEDVLRSVYSQAVEVGRFISGKETEVKKCDEMTPLSKRTAGGVMSPLRGC